MPPIPKRESDSTDPIAEPASELLGLVQQSDMLVNLLHGFFQQLDTHRSQDFEAIAESIAKTKAEIYDMRPLDMSRNRIPGAGAELQAITNDTETATNSIMTCAESILDLDASDSDLKDAIDNEVMKIFEACSFQDITGQRVSKIVKVLTQVEERVTRLAEALGISRDGQDDAAPAELTEAERRNRDLLLNGPAIGGPETNQDAVDDLFESLSAETPEATAEATAPAEIAWPDDPNSQDDIDALFA